MEPAACYLFAWVQRRHSIHNFNVYSDLPRKSSDKYTFDLLGYRFGSIIFLFFSFPILQLLNSLGAIGGSDLNRFTKLVHII